MTVQAKLDGRPTVTLATALVGAGAATEVTVQLDR